MSENEIDRNLEERKVKALEKIAASMDSLSLWFDEIEKDEWGERLEYYLHETFKKYIKPEK